jgi:hypothetical protein
MKLSADYAFVLSMKTQYFYSVSICIYHIEKIITEFKIKKLWKRIQEMKCFDRYTMQPFAHSEI